MDFMMDREDWQLRIMFMKDFSKKGKKMDMVKNFTLKLALR